MQSTRALPSRLLSRKPIIKITTPVIAPVTTTLSRTQTARNMSLYRPSFYANQPNFSGLFRLIDEFDKYSQDLGGSEQIQSFTPKFDMKETETAYELHGELPGIKKENVSIEFTDPQTIVVSGRTERTYTSGTPPSRLEGNKTGGAITESGETTTSEKQPHKVTVEDENSENSESQTVTKAQPQGEKKAQEHPKHKFWVSERSVGQFSRTFSFPGRVNTEDVKASLDNGILAVTVPKAKKPETRRIAIN